MSKLWTSLKSFWNAMTIKERLFGIFAIALIGVIEYRKILIDILVDAANRSFGKASAKTEALIKTEATDNKAADALVQEAADLKKEESSQTVTPDWNLKS